MPRRGSSGYQLQAMLADRDVRLIADAAPGAIDARVVQGADAVILLETRVRPLIASMPLEQAPRAVQRMRSLAMSSSGWC